MNPGFYLHKRHSRGNLHISILGEFNGMCAWELLKTIRLQRAGSGRVFIDTAKLDRILTEGVSLFKDHMMQKQLPQDWLYFKGKKGFEIAPNGSRVLVISKGGKRDKLQPPKRKKPFLSACSCNS